LPGLFLNFLLAFPAYAEKNEKKKRVYPMEDLL